MRDRANQLANDVRNLGRQMRNAGADPGETRATEDVAQWLEQLGNQRGNPDPRSMQALTSDALAKLQQVDLDLRKKFESGDDQLLLSGADEVPEAFRTQVQDYYRALGKKGGQ